MILLLKPMIWWQ